MNPIWGLLFKDRFRTPFSAYKMSVAEILVLAGLFFGIGYGITKGVNAILTFETMETVDEPV